MRLKPSIVICSVNFRFRQCCKYINCSLFFLYQIYCTFCIKILYIKIVSYYSCFLTSKGEKMAIALNKLFKYALLFNEALVLGTWSVDRSTNTFVHSNFSQLQACFSKFLQLARDTRDYLQKLTDEGYSMKLQNLIAQLSLGKS